MVLGEHCVFFRVRVIHYIQKKIYKDPRASSLMALFISSENQRILWDMIHRNKNIGVMHDRQKEEWFKSIIGQSYQSILAKYGQNISREQVMSLNREVLQTMMGQLQQFAVQQQAPPQMSQQPGMRPDPKLNTYASELDSRQQQYTAMAQKPAPPEVNFREQEDTAITNMEELIEKQRREREEEILKFAPPPPSKDAFKQTMASGNPGMDFSGGIAAASITSSVDSGRITALEARVAELEKIVASIQESL